jgi:hypothetical protein
VQLPKGHFHKGRKGIHVRGVPKGDKFSVHLKCPNNDVALHLCARFGPQDITLNSMQKGAWGDEVRLPIGSLKPNADCDVTIGVKKDKFVIGLDGKLHGEFPHRLPKEQIEDYEVEGLEIGSIKFPKSINFGGEAKVPKANLAADVVSVDTVL